MKNIYNCFENYTVIKIEGSNIHDVFELCKQNKKYYEYLQEQATLDAVQNMLTELPPNTKLKDKYFLGFYQNKSLVAILDIIDGYPVKGKAFIGLFMIDQALQGKGIGKNIIKQLLSFLTSKNYASCELGVIDTNVEAQQFWTKLGFEKTGKTYTHEKYNVIMMSCKL
ncbi:MAG: GNAT family N-acetyltransferase [Clostridia bacterium]|nr:GNAT family N-acetyltransferase [Clostridia bacterium]